MAGSDCTAGIFDFRKWAKESNLTENTLNQLQKEELDTLEILSSVNEDVIDKLGLSQGQKIALTLGIDKLVKSRSSCESRRGTHEGSDEKDKRILEKYTLEANREFRLNHHSPEIRIVLLGKTGSGKSSTGNAILGGKIFTVGSPAATDSTTKTCLVREGTNERVKVRIIDTPGLFDTDVTNDDILDELAKVLVIFPEGVHAFAFIFKAGSKFTIEEKETFEKLQHHFGDKLAAHIFIVMTNADVAFEEESLETFLHREKEIAKQKFEKQALAQNWSSKTINCFTDLLDRVNNRVMAIDNKHKDDESLTRIQRASFYSLVYKIINTADGNCYSNMYFKNVQEEIKRKEARRAEKLHSENIRAEGKPAKTKPAETMKAEKKPVEEMAKEKPTKQHTSVALITKAIRKYVKDCALDLSIKQLKAAKRNSYKKLVEEYLPKVRQHLQSKFPVEDITDKQIKTEIFEAIDEIEELLEKAKKKCFPACSKVLTRNGTCHMKNLEIGREVLTCDTKGLVNFQPVILFTRAVVKIDTTFVSIKTGNSAVLKISHEHLLHVCEIGNLQPAKSVAPGDTIFTLTACDGTMTLKPSVVESVTEEVCQGLFCPHTPGGSIIVDNVLASCYTNHFPLSLSRMLMLLARLLYAVLPSSWFMAIPYDTQLGMPSVVAKTRSLIEWAKASLSNVLTG